MGMVLANGSLSSQTGGEGEIRKKIVEADLVEGIVALPSQLFYSTQIPVSLWFINKAKKQLGKTLFIDARNMGEMVERTHRELTEEDIQKLASAFDAFNEGTLQDVKGFCAVVDKEDIVKQDSILTPGRYVGIEDVQATNEPLEETIKTLKAELLALFKESRKLEQEITQQLEQL
jgi:type I restriction enzyme M protein